MGKSELRRECREKLRKSSIDEAALLSYRSLLSHFLSKHSGVLCGYVASFQGEVDLSLLFNEELGRREVFLPVTLASRLEFHRIEGGWESQLTEGAHKSREPNVALHTSRAYAGQKGVILVPGLAFCRDGKRLGRGKGYYDRFLAEHENCLLSLGIAQSFQLVECMPTEEHDVSLDFICTEQELFQCRRD